MEFAGASVPPLDGITVIDFSELLPGPFFTQSLAELGAQVTKIERPPSGDSLRRMGPGVFDAVNRGKKSLLADLKDEAQWSEVLALIAEADVVVESYRPGVMKRLGLDALSLRAKFPRLVYVSLSGYGQTGPWADLPGHDINYLAAAGVLAVSGSPEGGPAQSFGLPMADLCGAMYALSSTLAALLQRERTGEGQYLDVALADCALHWMNPRLGAYREAGAVALDAQRDATLLKAAYGTFRCRDGHYVSIAALEDHFWQNLCGVLDLGPFAADSYRLQDARKSDAADINRRIAEQLQDLDSVDAFARLAQHDVPAAPMVEPSGLASVPQFAERGKLEDGAQMPLARYPVRMTGVHPYGPGSAPEFNNGRRS